MDMGQLENKIEELSELDFVMECLGEIGANAHKINILSHASYFGARSERMSNDIENTSQQIIDDLDKVFSCLSPKLIKLRREVILAEGERIEKDGE